MYKPLLNLYNPQVALAAPPRCVAAYRRRGAGGPRGGGGGGGDVAVGSLAPLRSREFTTPCRPLEGGHLQGVLYSTRGAQTSKTLVTDVVNIQDSRGGLEGV
eukprot:780160-Prorocentrum_minimum.AAC.1